jgi:hypothetical protein
MGNRRADHPGVRPKDRARCRHAYPVYTNGHPYLIMAAPGQMKNQEDSTSKTHVGAYYAILDAESGKLLSEGTWEGHSSTLLVEDANGGIFLSRIRTLLRPPRHSWTLRPQSWTHPRPPLSAIPVKLTARDRLGAWTAST